ncbi:DUF6544 family protein [Serratia sp. DD3]|uniref:DUF6920 family protein n=1 Tax=Serratia sp. DD3 TaxID=1410619 RepID=UPI0004D98C04|nr:DUF6544 family protein [Serratia sp. DD3]KEY59790.1 hypothetical protein SRDD_13690 [Serratia sp. DD3]
MRKGLMITATLFILFIMIAGFIGVNAILTEREIATFAKQVRDSADSRAVTIKTDSPEFMSLPEPVQRYFKFVFRGSPQPLRYVELTMEGDFRRPLTTQFTPMEATQTIAIHSPSLLFTGTTPIFLGVWAKAYDAFYDGEMTMKAKIMSTFTVVSEHESPELNRISLRRWLLESPLYPQALLPGGVVRWEAINANQARAIVSAQGISASLVATFREDGSLERFNAEQDGDLTTPYHGSGEQVVRTDYRLVNDMMIPFGFVISRVAGGKDYPFWQGKITDINFYH